LEGLWNVVGGHHEQQQQQQNNGGCWGAGLELVSKIGGKTPAILHSSVGLLIKARGSATKPSTHDRMLTRTARFTTPRTPCGLKPPPTFWR
jgi:hypothetical protein